MKTYSERQPDSFRPLTVSFTIETEEELKTLHDFFGYDVSIPREYYKLSKCSVKESNIVQTFMSCMSSEICKNV